MMLICTKKGAWRYLLLFCFVVIGFLVTPSAAGFRPFEYDLIEEQSLEFERADGDGDGLDALQSSDIETPSTGTESELERKFNAMLKARNLTDQISSEMIHHQFESVAMQKKNNRIIGMGVNATLVKERLSRLDAIKLAYKDLFEQKSLDEPETPPKKEDFPYDEQLAKTRMLPMAAAAYGKRENVLQCLNQAYGHAVKLINYTVEACQNHKSEECGGFLALSEREEAIILSFRGTNSVTQLLIEIGGSLKHFWNVFTGDLIDTIEMPANRGGVNSYFYDIFTDIWITREMVLDVARVIKENPRYKIYVTGHSLGGALAAIAARHIQMDIIPSQPERIHLLTLGQPRTGDEKWAILAEEALLYFNYRIVYGVDLVPHLPPYRIPLRSSIVAQHMKTEVWYTEDINPNDNSPTICPESGESSKCSNTEWSLSLSKFIKKFHVFINHNVYFGKCVPAFGRHGCRLSRDSSDRYSKCDDQEFMNEFLIW